MWRKSVRSVGAELRDVKQSEPPVGEQLLEDALAVRAHLAAGGLQVRGVGPREQLHEMRDVMEVRDVWELVEVGELQPVADGVAVPLVVRVGPLALRRVRALVRAARPLASDAFPRALNEQPVLVLPVDEQIERREEERHVHAILLEDAHDGRLVGHVHDAAERDELLVQVVLALSDQLERRAKPFVLARELLVPKARQRAFEPVPQRHQQERVARRCVVQAGIGTEVLHVVHLEAREVAHVLSLVAAVRGEHVPAPDARERLEVRVQCGPRRRVETLVLVARRRPHDEAAVEHAEVLEVGHRVREEERIHALHLRAADVRAVECAHHLVGRPASVDGVEHSQRLLPAALTHARTVRPLRQTPIDELDAERPEKTLRDPREAYGSFEAYSVQQEVTVGD